jgi:hypothetical protein
MITLERQKAVANRLFENISKIRYGSASVTLKIHDGRIVDITHTVTESQREYPESYAPNRGRNE